MPLAEPATEGAFYRDWRLVSIDGTCLDVADTPANEGVFGRPGTGRGQGVGAFPQVRLVGLGECGTHALLKVQTGPYRTGEQTLAVDLLDGLAPGMLCLADRLFYSFELWKKASATGAELLWRDLSGTAPMVLALFAGMDRWVRRLKPHGKPRDDRLYFH